MSVDDALTTVKDGAEADLDDQTPAVGDSIHTYLKTIGRTALLTAEQEVDLAKRIEAGLFAEHKLEAGGRLDEGYKGDLEAVAEDGRRAKAHMLEANLRLVVSVAKKYADRGELSLLDIVQDGNLGLIRAVEKFDYTKGYKFSTYAMWWIRQGIQRGFADGGRTIRLPAHVLELLSKLNRVERQLLQDLGREATPEELAIELDLVPEKVIELQRLSRYPVSLQTEIGEDGETSIGDQMEDLDRLDPSDELERRLLAELLEAALDSLEPKEAVVLAMRFGLYDGHYYSYAEIARAIALTGWEQAKAVERRALAQLRKSDRSELLLEYAS